MFFFFLISFWPAMGGLAANAATNAFHFDGGAPGCWSEIRASSLSSAELKALSRECQVLRADYLQTLELAEKKPAELIRKLNSSLSEAKRAIPPYEAILFSSLSTSPEVKKGLEARTKVEAKLKLPFRYAEAALWRMQGHACTEKKQYLHPFYREVCTGRDSLLSGYLTTLNQSSVAGAHP